MKLALVIAAIVAAIVIPVRQHLLAPPPTLQLHGQIIKLELADTETKRARGLSGRSPLARDEGMLFVFPGPTKPGFWMKEMKFPLDLVWLDEKWRVVDLIQNATPESYPQTFTPPAPVKYVLEVTAGFVNRNHLKVGDTVQGF